MKKLAYTFIAIGILLAVFFFVIDRNDLGAAQLFGIEIGILLALIGIGFLTLDSLDSLPRPDLRAAGRWLLSLPPSVWAGATLLTVYLALFVSPLFFSKPAINYFVKYIPDAWVTRIGFDVEQTVSHVQAWLAEGVSPYADGIVPYSPLTLLVFAPMVVIGYPAYFKLLTLLSVAGYVLAGLLIPLWIQKRKSVVASGRSPASEATPSMDGRLLRRDARKSIGAGERPAFGALRDPRRDTSLILLFFLTGLVSYGFQFELERGQFNVIAFAACLSAIYLFHYHHKFRYFAYLLFSLAVQLKLYPAIFVVMFVRDWRDWKGNLKRFIGLGLANFALLFVAGYELGMQYIHKMIQRQGGFQSSRVEDLSISGFVYHLTTDGLGLLSSETTARLAQSPGLISTILLLAFLACLAFLLYDAWKRNQPGLDLSLLAVCALGALFIPAGSFDYKLPILVAPLSLFLSSLAWPASTNKRIVSILLTVILSLAYWSTLAPFTVKPQGIAGNFPALYAILFCVAALHFLTGRKENSLR